MSSSAATIYEAPIDHIIFDLGFNVCVEVPRQQLTSVSNLHKLTQAKSFVKHEDGRLYPVHNIYVVQDHDGRYIGWAYDGDLPNHRTHKRNSSVR
jgi:hypothetical protein